MYRPNRKSPAVCKKRPAPMAQNKLAFCPNAVRVGDKQTALVLEYLQICGDIAGAADKHKTCAVVGDGLALLCFLNKLCKQFVEGILTHCHGCESYAQALFAGDLGCVGLAQLIKLIVWFYRI